MSGGGSSAGARRRALEVLGLSGSPTRRDVMSAYHRRVRATHPDTAATPDPAQFAAVVAAYRLLSGDPGDPGTPGGPSSAPVAARPVPVVRVGRREAPGSDPAAWRSAPLVAGPSRFVPEDRGRSA